MASSQQLAMLKKTSLSGLATAASLGDPTRRPFDPPQERVRVEEQLHSV
jgi:hypothetical protein